MRSARFDEAALVWRSAIDSLPTRWAGSYRGSPGVRCANCYVATGSIVPALSQVAAQVGRLQENEMKRLLPFLLLLPLLVGCRRTAPATDPFSVWGKSRIPPPATGSGTQDEYYRPGTSRPVPATATTGWKSVSRGSRTTQVSGLASQEPTRNRRESADKDSARTDVRQSQVVSR